MGRGCGGGGLRILPHKSWNVYGFDNKLRVKQDEAKHAEEEEKMRVYTRRVDAEKRLEVMRRKRSQEEDEEEKEDEEEEQLDEEAKENGNDDRNNEHDEYGDEDAAPARPASKRRNLGGSYRSTSSTTASASRYAVVQEEGEDESTTANDASTTAAATAASSSSSSAAPLQHFTLFPDIVGSMKSQEIARVREEDKRKKEMSEIRKYASATMFVEALRAPEDGSAASSSRPGAAASSSNTLRPWYAQSHHERDAHSHRSQELNKKRVIVRRHGADGKMHVERNLSGQHVSTIMNDPLERMKERMREEREKEKREEEENARKHGITIKTQSPIIPPSRHHTSSHIGSSSSLLIAAALPPLSRNISTDSMPPLQPAASSPSLAAANDLNSPPPLDTLSNSELRRTRWNGTTAMSTHSPSTSTTTLNSAMHFTPNVGFTNSSHEEVQRQLEQQHVRPLFPSALAIINSSSAATVSRSSISRADRRDAVSISSSSSSSSDSDSDSDSSSSSSHRSSKSKKKSKQHKKKHEKERKSKKSKKRKRDHELSSSSDDEESDDNRKSHKKSKKSKKQKRSSSSKKDKKSSTRREEKKRSTSSSHSRSTAVSSSLAPPPSSSSSFLSLAELRAERETREREERQKTAALLGVPHWATADRGAVRTGGGGFTYN